MSRAARSLLVWSWYLLALGVVVMIAPNRVLVLFGVPTTTEVWIRIVGMFLLFVGALDWIAARRELTVIFVWATAARFAVPVFFGAFCALGLAPVTLMLFAALDVVAATWTALALRADRRDRGVVAVNA